MEKVQRAKIGVSGSFVNQMMSNNATLPTVGKGATQLHYTDRSVYEVLEVSTDGKTVKLEIFNQCKSEFSSEIKTEVLQIIEAFNLGEYKSLLSFTPSTKVEGYILTQFETTLGTYNHYFKIK